MIKQGNQMYLEFQVYDKDNNLLDITSVEKVQFNINSLTKTYDGVSTEVTYDSTNKKFLVWLTEQETFAFNSKMKYDARIKFNNDTIMGTYVEQGYVIDSLKEVLLDDETPSL